MKKLLLAAALSLSVCALSLWAAGQAPLVKPQFPSPDGYLTLLADLHQHTVFSDGAVWPTTRVTEAKREGLDVIAITDHIEYTPYKGDIPVKHGRSCQIAKEAGDREGILVIPGLEITRGTQYATGDKGIRHINCLFLTNFNALVTPNLKDAVYAAAEQGAYIFWNHPAWAQVDHKSVWYPEMDEFLEKGILKGFEVANGSDYQPDVIEWCQKHQVAQLGNSDIHNVAAYDIDWTKGDHRTMTLIFAKERTVDSVREALFAGRTAVYCYTEGVDLLIGNEEWLRALFEKAVTFEPTLSLGKNSAIGKVKVTLHNNFTFPVELKCVDSWWIDLPQSVKIPARGSAQIEVNVKDANFGAELEVVNFHVAKHQALKIKIGK